jgi:dihydrofolate reductase/thymidylate synthase
MMEIVVAADEGGGIGKEGRLPWKLPGDTAFLKRITTETTGKPNAVLMGRKTWETIPPKWRPLPRRLNVVVTRQRGYDVPEGVLVAPSLPAAHARAAPLAERVFVLGGGEIYREALSMPECRRAYVTRVEGRHPADAFFPALGAEWRLVDESARQEENGTGYVFQVWER